MFVLKTLLNTALALMFLSAYADTSTAKLLYKIKTDIYELPNNIEFNICESLLKTDSHQERNVKKKFDFWLNILSLESNEYNIIQIDQRNAVFGKIQDKKTNNYILGFINNDFFFFYSIKEASNNIQAFAFLAESYFQYKFKVDRLKLKDCQYLVKYNIPIEANNNAGLDDKGKIKRILPSEMTPRRIPMKPLEESQQTIQYP